MLRESKDLVPVTQPLRYNMGQSDGFERLFAVGGLSYLRSRPEEGACRLTLEGAVSQPGGKAYPSGNMFEEVSWG